MAREIQVKKNQGTVESILALWLILFLVFEVLLLTVVLVRSFKHTAPPKEPSAEQSTQPDGEKDPTEPAPSVPVFSGGVLPSAPTASSETVILSNEVFSQFAILIDAQSGEILAGKDYTTSFSPASMTKVMTLIVACEQLKAEDLDRRLVFDEKVHQYITSGSYADTSPSLPTESNGYSCFGDTYTIRDLLYGIGVASAADCTYMIVREIAGSEEAFVELMNQKARELNLSSTHFDNAVGFDSPTNQTTAADMAVIMNYAMQSDLIADILSKQTSHDIYAHYEHNGQDKTYKVTLTSSWKSRLEKYPSFNLTSTTLVATKTGYTDQSFMVLTAKSKLDEQCYIVVLGNRESTATTISEKFRQTMTDIEWLLNTYVS